MSNIILANVLIINYLGFDQGQACGERHRLLGSRVLLYGAGLHRPLGTHTTPVRRDQVGPRAEGAAVRAAGAEAPRGIVLFEVGQM